ncbi:SMP-30/gluconolactonase/LRE family protein [Microbacterium sp.]|uniref:SMP-30/gluconolactonase/LRE family protein n=1 Tax=Microbacterium sp. TaxID=51671 RepID=UPI002810A16C|nr:SBBP repeat-containing protein [Microbacterium sp.]
MLLRSTATAVAAAAVIALGSASPALADQDDRHHRGESFTLTGDAAGSRFEGIAADERRGVFYVSETTGGEIHRGDAGTDQTVEWLAPGADGRTTARGMTVDKDGNLYIAGGPNGLGTGLPDVWVYSPEGELLTALRMPASDVFVNDVVIGPDGAAYFTDSNDPRIYRVALEGGEWTATVWADATGTITRQAGFNLGGIEVSPDGNAFIVAQGNVGKLWRFGMDGSISEIPTGGVDLVNADGLVLQGTSLTVVRNFSRVVTTLRVAADAGSATLVAEQPSSPTRVLTTAAELRGEILYVDSEFGPNPPVPPYEVVTDPFE